MSKQVRTLTIELSFDLDAETLDNLPCVDGFYESPDSFTCSTTGAHDLKVRSVDACIREVARLFTIANVGIRLEDCAASIGEAHAQAIPDDWLY